MNITYFGLTTEQWTIVGPIVGVISLLIAIYKIIKRRKKSEPSVKAVQSGRFEQAQQISIGKVNQLTIQQGVIPMGAGESILVDTNALAGNIAADLKAEIDKAVFLINEGRLDSAKTELFRILGKIESNKDKYGKEIARIYNNIGICFNRQAAESSNVDEAIRYFHIAHEYDPDLWQADINLASAYLNKGTAEYYKKAYEISKEFWDNQKGDPIVTLQIFIQAIYHFKSPAEVIDFIEKDEKAGELIYGNEILTFLVGDVYLRLGDHNKSISMANSRISTNPNSFRNLTLKGKALMAKAHKEKIIPSSFDSVPKFQDYKDIEDALDLLIQAYNIAKDKDVFFANQIEIDRRVCLIWLNRAKEAKDRAIKESIDRSLITEEQNRFLRIQDFEIEFGKRNFEAAYYIFINDLDWDDIHYSEKKRIAYMFFNVGAIELCENLLRKIELEATNNKDIEYWINMSMVHILLNQKLNAINYAEKAKNLSSGTESEKIALQNYNSVMVRYARSGESDRLLSGLFDMQNKYPDEEIVKPVRALNDSGSISQEMKSILLDQKNRYENIRSIFKTQNAPSYLLERIFQRPFVDIISWGIINNDPEFTFKFASPSREFFKEISVNLKKCEELVFDYSSLLNASKMGILGFFGRLGKRIIITDKLFNKIQSELLSKEQPDLRHLWDFLRGSKEIQILDCSASSKLSEKVGDVFNEWLLGSMNIAKDENTVFVTDDLVLLRASESEVIHCTNTMAILKELQELKLIDNKMYSECLGDLAERLYVFLPYSGDDLFYIVVEDEARITLRSYHLVNQMLLPGSNIKSFTAVFVRFVDLLWSTGFLPDQKTEWLRFISNKVIELLDKRSTDIKSQKDHDELIDTDPDLTAVWIIATEKSNKDELLAISKLPDKVLNKPYLEELREFIKAKISDRLKPK